ncbi:Calcium and integrin binding family member 2 [Carabus blaptoides fortunei]
MGNSASFAGLSEEMLDDYALLTYLSKREILSLLKKFYTLGQLEMDQNFHHRFPCEYMEEIVPSLKCNPFKDRIYKVFSSQKDNCFSFEDMLDLCSVMSQNCPDKIKASWAFKIFDFNNDEKIDDEDIIIAINRLIWFNKHDITDSDKRYIAETLLDTMNIQNTGSINSLEFEHAVGKMSEFAQTFTFSI